MGVPRPHFFFFLVFDQVLEAQRLEKEAREETLALQAELRALSENSNRLQQHLKGQMDTQMRFSMVSFHHVRSGRGGSGMLTLGKAHMRSIQHSLREVSPFLSFENTLSVPLIDSVPVSFFQLGRLSAAAFLTLIIIINPLTARVVGAPQMILQPVFSIFPCSPPPPGTCRTPGLSIP